MLILNYYQKVIRKKYFTLKLKNILINLKYKNLKLKFKVSDFIFAPISKSEHLLIMFVNKIYYRIL